MPHMGRSMPKIENAITTIKISRRASIFIERHAEPGESVDDTLQRLLKLHKNGHKKPDELPPLAKTIKISRIVMNHILDEALPKESRGVTLERLLGLEHHDGNVTG
jgi:hypothetical protein